MGNYTSTYTGQQIDQSVANANTWYTDLVLDASKLNTLVKGGQIVGTLPVTYSPAHFNRDLFKVAINTTPESTGGLLKETQEITSIRVDLSDFESSRAFLQKAAVSAIISFGFDYNYYRGIVVAAGTNDDINYVYNGSIEGNNVMYIQDITSQDWEIKADDDYKDPKMIELYRDRMGGAILVHIKGTSEESNFIMCLEDSYLAYWDATNEKVGWLPATAGKFYQTYFDGTGGTQHGTLRWLAVPATVAGEVVAAELTPGVMAYLRNTGIAFSGYAARVLVDESIKLKTECLGYGLREIDGLLSWNTPFVTTTAEKVLDLVLRPTAYQPKGNFVYEKSGTIIEETEGLYVWTGMTDSNDTLVVTVPKGHPTDYIISLSSSSLPGETVLYRHTLMIKTEPMYYEFIGEGGWAINCSATALNLQGGEDTIDYIVTSDMKTPDIYTPDWILQASGFCGRIANTGTVEAPVYTVQTWYPVMRLIAGWKPVEGGDPIRCVYCTYFNTTTGTVEKTTLSTDENVIDGVTMDNMKCYTGRDFRSEIPNIAIWNY